MIDFQAFYDGIKSNPPKNWADLEETFEYGVNSNQPVVDTTEFVFYGDSMLKIYEHYQNGDLLDYFSFDAIYKQKSVSVDIYKDYFIDFTSENFRINFEQFNNRKIPKTITSSIKSKKSQDFINTELSGITWGLLYSQGLVSNSDYTTVKTAVVKLYNFTEVALALITLYVLYNQIEDLIKDIQDTVTDSTRESTNTNPGGAVGTIVWIIVNAILKVAAGVVLVAVAINITAELLAMLVPPVIKHKGITLKRGAEIIFNYLGYNLNVDTLPEMDNVYLPSNPHSNENDTVLDNFPTYPAIINGFPNYNDYGYIAADFIALIVQRFNARIDVLGDTVFIRNEDDPAFFEQSSFVPDIDLLYETKRPNISEIPRTRLIAFSEDINDTYTSENTLGNIYEVNNVSNGIPFKGVERIDLPVARGTPKTNLNSIENWAKEIAAAGDQVTELLGGKGNLASTIKNNRTGILKVSDHNFTVPKLLPLQSGKMPNNALELMSAKSIENNYYINRSIVRGTGQKMLYEDVKIPFNVVNRNQVLGNGNFITSDGMEATIRSLNWKFSEDIATTDFEVKNDYLASNSFEEILIEPE